MIDLNSLEFDDYYDVYKDYKTSTIRVIKKDLLSKEVVGEVLIDLRNNQLLYKDVNIIRRNFKEPREEELYHFDYGIDSIDIYNIVNDFYIELYLGDISFKEITSVGDLPLFKYLKLKIEHPSLEILNNFFDDEIVLYSVKLKEMSISELITYFKRLDRFSHIEDMYEIPLTILEFFNNLLVKDYILDYIYYTEYFLKDLNYSEESILEFYSYCKDLKILNDYPLFLKFIECLRYTSDIYMINRFLYLCIIKKYSLHTIVKYINNHLKKCRYEENNKIKYSSNILTEILNEEGLKNIRVKDLSVIDNRIEELINLFSSGYIKDFSELVLNLNGIYTNEDFDYLIEGFKIEFSKKISNNN